MAQSDPVEKVRVTVRVVGRRPVQPSEQTWQLQVEPKLGPALNALVEELGSRAPAELLHGCLVILNGKNVQALTLETKLRDGDVFMIVPPVAGGC